MGVVGGAVLKGGCMDVFKNGVDTVDVDVNTGRCVVDDVADVVVGGGMVDVWGKSSAHGVMYGVISWDAGILRGVARGSVTTAEFTPTQNVLFCCTNVALELVDT